MSAPKSTVTVIPAAGGWMVAEGSPWGAGEEPRARCAEVIAWAIEHDPDVGGTEWTYPVVFDQQESDQSSAHRAEDGCTNEWKTYQHLSCQQAREAVLKVLTSDTRKALGL